MNCVWRFGKRDSKKSPHDIKDSLNTSEAIRTGGCIEEVKNGIRLASGDVTNESISTAILSTSDDGTDISVHEVFVASRVTGAHQGTTLLMPNITMQARLMARSLRLP